MSQDYLTISRVVPVDDHQSINPADFLQQLRHMVQEAKLSEPHLAQSQLCDLGFVQDQDGVKVNLYFSK